ncbi:hypothetical protein BN946_scf184786.g8 [Trametes cinnabarina]|uniref:RTA1 like protein n=1 Tax=Pycnoporus cinnabarinus TaxID=5643 RepID=A0A060SS57_PYCCI|nr:hypothetical protein BN946_scf184786.g8 [Trametes cinnabarina]
MVVLFGITTALHIVQAAWSRLWWLFPTAVLAGVMELIGWSGRLWSSINPLAVNPYLMQIVATIIAPTPFIAANFVILGHIIKRLGSQYSRISAKWYTILFCSCDFIALIVQALGGAQAAGAGPNNLNLSIRGGHIMLGGIIFQLVAICTYATLALEFLLRYHHDRPFKRESYPPPKREGALDRGTKRMVFALFMMWIFIFIRRLIDSLTQELSDGWTGRIIKTERYFNVLDGAMIVLAMFTLNFFHPGLLLGKAHQWKDLEASLMDPLRKQEKQTSSQTSESLL